MILFFDDPFIENRRVNYLIKHTITTFASINQSIPPTSKPKNQNTKHSTPNPSRATPKIQDKTSLTIPHLSLNPKILLIITNHSGWPSAKNVVLPTTLLYHAERKKKCYPPKPLISTITDWWPTKCVSVCARLRLYVCTARAVVKNRFNWLRYSINKNSTTKKRVKKSPNNKLRAKNVIIFHLLFGFLLFPGKISLAFSDSSPAARCAAY